MFGRTNIRPVKNGLNALLLGQTGSLGGWVCVCVGGGGGGVEREIICLSLHCHHQNDSCIQMGSNETHFNV